MRRSLASKILIVLFLLFLLFLVLLIYAQIIRSISVITTLREEAKKPIYYVETDEKKVAFSFDAAWGADKTESIMDVMESNDARATFFVVKFWVENYPDMAKQIVDRGHELQNHSSTHPHFNSLSIEQIKEEVLGCASLIQETTGFQPTLFRPPFGEYNNKVVKTIESLGYRLIQWDCDSLDWKELSAAEIESRILSKVHNGSIVLFHNNGLHTVEALRSLLPKLKEEGYEVCSVSELIYPAPYEIDPHSGAQKRSIKK